MWKIFSVACAVSLSAALFTGCIDYDSNNDGTSHTGLYSLRANDTTRNGTNMNGTGMSGTTGTRGNSINIFEEKQGVGSRSLTDRRGTGTGTTGGEGTSVYNTTGINSISETGDISGILRDENTLVIGNMIIIGTREKQGIRGMNNSRTLMNLNFGTDANVLQVTDKEAIDAIKRVNATIHRNSGIANFNQISSDINLILQNAKPIKNNR